LGRLLSLATNIRYGETLLLITVVINKSFIVQAPTVSDEDTKFYGIDTRDQFQSQSWHRGDKYQTYLDKLLEDCEAFKEKKLEENFKASEVECERLLEKLLQVPMLKPFFCLRQ
jgi:hypothetical protein